MQIDTTNLGIEEPADPEPVAQVVDPDTSNGAPQSAARASADTAGDDFDILDRLDSLLSDDPSKSSPRSDK